MVNDQRLNDHSILNDCSRLKLQAVRLKLQAVRLKLQASAASLLT